MGCSARACPPPIVGTRLCFGPLDLLWISAGTCGWVFRATGSRQFSLQLGARDLRIALQRRNLREREEGYL